MILSILLVSGVAWSQALMPAHESSSIPLVQKYYERVTGLTLTNKKEAEKILLQATGSDGRLSEDKLFAKLFSSRGFVENRIASLVSELSNEENEPFQDVDDFQAALMLNLLTQESFRSVFVRPFFLEGYRPNVPLQPAPRYYNIGPNFDSLQDLSSKVRLNFSRSPEVDKVPVAGGNYREGLFTTSGFGARYMNGGTNRRPVRAIFNIFLCKPIESWKNPNLDPFYIGKDVDHNPGGDPGAFNEKCRACHAPMDAMRGAFAHYDQDAQTDRLVRSDRVQPKYNQNDKVFDSGYRTYNDQWEILMTSPEYQEMFGWQGPTKGRGILSFAETVTNSRRFQACMTSRLLARFCDLNNEELAQAIETPEFEALAKSFRDIGYKTKPFIRQIVKSSLCN